MIQNTKTNHHLQRQLGLFGAILMGLGSILGTGIFVSIGLGAGIAGPSVIITIMIAALVATCNALSSAQLAAAHPVSGGTYEYGYQYLTPALGFIAGWMFLLAKSASAATAALGFSGYLLSSFGVVSLSKIPIALFAVIVFTIIVLSGIRRSNHANIAIVSITIFSLLAFIFTGLWYALDIQQESTFQPFLKGDDLSAMMSNLFHASALMFVAFTGYGRIATLAEEVKSPQQTIPRAIIATLLVSSLLYISVSIAGIGSVGAEFLFNATAGKAAPLELAAQEFGVPFISWLVTLGAITAMLGVLLNLILGLSRVLLAMGRRHDMPNALAKLDQEGKTPWVAVLVTGTLIAALTLVGNVKTTWSFSAFTVLIYYAITNAAAIAMPQDQRLFPLIIPFIGLVSCLFLAFWVEWQIWLLGLILLLMGLVWHFIFMRS